MITVKSLQKSDGTKSLVEKQQEKILAWVKYVRVIVYKIVGNVSNVVKKYTIKKILSSLVVAQERWSLDPSQRYPSYPRTPHRAHLTLSINTSLVFAL